MLGLFIFVAIVAGIFGAITGVARWFGASRWLAFSIPIIPLVVLMAYFLITNAAEVGEGGALPYWIGVGIWLLIALPVSAITVFVVPKRNDKRSA
jgi:hypothetical protein